MLDLRNVPTAAGVEHLYFFNREWFFTFPWMVLNEAFGGYTAYAVVSSQLDRTQPDALGAKHLVAGGIR
jgi:hypothetical protein